jgi:hypothetical protein
VRPEELRNFLAANNLQIKEVTKGGGKSSEDLWIPEDSQEQYNPNDEHSVTKFGSYTLPGGQNYREMLLQLPDRMPAKESFEQWRERVARESGMPVEDTPEERRNYQSDSFIHQQNVYQQGARNFTASHWDEPNVVGHVRFNDRQGPNGERLLHLEELQSDWHQKGRTQGYRGETKTLEDAKKFFGISDAAWQSMPQSQRQSYFDEMNSNEDYIRRGKRDMVPDAPFKKTWPELLMKRMVRYAAENGYDGVSWTPGEEQASRYDLSKQVDKISYHSPDGGKTWNWSARQKISRGPGQGPAGAWNEMASGNGQTASQVADHLGKDIAQKMQGSVGRESGAPENSGELSGLDLKVGGEGMKGFYDKIVPDLANKLGKQFGAKVGETKIDVPVHSRQRDGGIEMGGTKSVPYFPITDSMRESVLKQGQPLFARENRPNNGLPDNLEEMIRSNVFKNQPKEYQDLVMDSLRRVASGQLSDRELKAADFLKNEQDRNFEIGSSNDILHHYIEDYMTRVYKDTNPQGKVISSEAKGGRFATNVSMAKQRVYDSNLTALLKSPKQMELDPATVTAKGRAMLIKAAANKQLIDTLRDKFTRASDGRPAVVLSGSGQVVSGPNGEDPKTFIDPSRVRKINIAPEVVSHLQQTGDLQRFLDDGTIKDITPYVHPSNIGAAIDRLEEQAGKQDANYDEVGNNKLRTQIMYLKSMMVNRDFSGLKEFNDGLGKVYSWNPQDYISVDSGALRGWNFVTNDSAGHNVFVRSNILIHPEFAEYLKNRLGLEPSDIAKHPIGKALLGAGTRLKQTLLSLSPFHMVQEALRGIMVGVNPFHITGPDILNGEKIDPADPNSPTIIRKAVENGYMPGTNYQAMQEHSEGLSSGGGLLNKIPVVGKTIGSSLNWYQDLLFRRYIPSLSNRAVELMYREYERLHPDWSVDRIAKAAALHTNDTFGSPNWRAMGRSATTQDWARLALLAPSWLESEMRSGARLFNRDEGGLARAQVLKMSLGLWGIARVLNLVTTGKPHLEAPFGLATQSKDGKEVVFSIRTLPTDLLHAASDPVGFLKGRLSPVVRAGEELTTQRDQYGRKLQPSDLWADTMRNMIPIPLQAAGQAVSGTGPEVGNVGQFVKAVGGTAQTYSTPAQKLAADLASSHSEEGAIDPAQMARHRTIMGFEDKIRAGEMSLQDIYKMYAAGQLHEDDLRKISENVKKTKDMDPAIASLYTRASRLPGPEFLQLYDEMNPAEKTALLPLTLQVRKRYIAKAMKDLRPEERLKDPTFMRFLNMVTDQSPF